MNIFIQIDRNLKKIPDNSAQMMEKVTKELIFESKGNAEKLYVEKYIELYKEMQIMKHLLKEGNRYCRDIFKNKKSNRRIRLDDYYLFIGNIFRKNFCRLMIDEDQPVKEDSWRKTEGIINWLKERNSFLIERS